MNELSLGELVHRLARDRPGIIDRDIDVGGDLGFKKVALAPADLYRRALANRPDLRAEIVRSPRA